jgi:hypothetical protein
MDIVLNCVRTAYARDKLAHRMLPPPATGSTATKGVYSASTHMILACMLAYTETAAGSPLIAELLPHSSMYATEWLTTNWTQVRRLVHAEATQIPLPGSEHWRSLLCCATEKYLMVHIDNGYDVTSCDYWQ